MSREYIVRCSEEDCHEAAVYKIAAPWTDGHFSELKTYGFACAEHVRDVLRSAEVRWLDYEPVPGEKVQEIGIFRYEPGKCDRELVRETELEEELRS